MMKTLSKKKQKEMLYKAIEQAKGIGKCSYTGGCVIGQLAMQLGISKEEMRGWRHNVVGDVISFQSSAAPLEQFDAYLLECLQYEWDRYRAVTDHTVMQRYRRSARKKMKRFVDEWFHRST